MLDSLRAAQGSTCTIVKAECYVEIPDTPDNIMMTVQHIKRQIYAISGSEIP